MKKGLPKEAWKMGFTEETYKQYKRARLFAWIFWIFLGIGMIYLAFK